MRLEYLPTSVLAVWLLFATSARAQENPLEDPDLQQLLKQAQEMQKNARDLQKSLNKISLNGKITRILLLSTRTDPRQEVALEVSRERDSKITQVEISSPVPKPEIGSE